MYCNSDLWRSCFVKFTTTIEAEKAIAALNNQHFFPGEQMPITVKYSGKPDRERERHGALDKVFVAMFNKEASKEEIMEVCSCQPWDVKLLFFHKIFTFYLSACKYSLLKHPNILWKFMEDHFFVYIYTDETTVSHMEFIFSFTFFIEHLLFCAFMFTSLISIL
ncbi:uncharacterized protein LOC133799834 [Humulus lupulus]|uniref:uncharacterized protein LOC133799834 n=1 Tax=Humulus lupulus TaxID=3486 RepID=UPI002B409C7C|nr:uncharacterized protein LOC133799834 [Humulus lupulus]